MRTAWAVISRCRAEEQLVAQRLHVTVLRHQLQVPRPVLHVAVQHGAAHLVVLDDDTFVDSALCIAQHQRLAVRPAEEIAGGKQVDAADLELRRQHRTPIPTNAELGEMRGAYPRLLEQRRDQTVRAVAMLDALADRVNAGIERLQRVVDQHSAVAT